MEREENSGLGPAYATRLGDLRGWHLVEVRCFACGHLSQLGAERLRRLRREVLKRRYHFPRPDSQLDNEVANERLKDIGGRLRCGRCGNRANNSFKVVKRGRNG